MLSQLSAALDPAPETVPFLKRFKTSTLRSLSLTRLESLQRLGELASWLYLYGRDEQLMSLAQAMLGYEFTGSFTHYGPVEDILSLGCLVAERHGDPALAQACRDHIVGVYGRREEWDDVMRMAMRNRLGGWQVEWQERNRPADDAGYTLAQLGELAYLRIWGGEQSWPLERIELTLADKTAYLRRLKKISPISP